MSGLHTVQEGGSPDFLKEVHKEMRVGRQTDSVPVYVVIGHNSHNYY